VKQPEKPEKWGKKKETASKNTGIVPCSERKTVVAMD